MFKLFKKQVEKTQIDEIKENGVVYALNMGDWGFMYHTEVSCTSQNRIDVYDNETVDFIENKANKIIILRGNTKEELFQKSLSL